MPTHLEDLADAATFLERSYPETAARLRAAAVRIRERAEKVQRDVKAAGEFDERILFAQHVLLEEINGGPVK